MSRLCFAVLLVCFSTLLTPSASLRADDDQVKQLRIAADINELLKVESQRKGALLPQTGKQVGDHSVVCELNMAEKWRINISLSNNRKFAFLVFPCCNPGNPKRKNAEPVDDRKSLIRPDAI